MLNLHKGFEVMGVFCFEAPDQVSTFFYLPLAADCQRREDGKPAANLMVAGETAFLQLSTVWDVPAARLEEARRAIAVRFALDDPALVRLAFAPVTVDSVRLLAGDGDIIETELELATARPSGLAPHSAMFNLTLRGADQTRAAAAFSGRTGFLRVRYDASLRAPVRHEARLHGDLSAVRSSVDLETALAGGQAVLEIAAEDVALRDAFIDRAVEILRVRSGSAGGQTEIVIELVLPEVISLRAETDVGNWFEAGDQNVLPTLGSGGGQPSVPGHDDGAQRDGLSVTVDVPGVEDVVALVEVSTGSARGRLTSPGFDPIVLPWPEGGREVRLKTSYTTGGKPFESKREPPGDGRLRLEAGDLGLMEITLDAAPLAKRGLDCARSTICYRPHERGERDTRTFHLRRPPFRTKWLLISRGEPLGESLTYDLRATLASGARLRHGPVAARSPVITLETTDED